MVTRFLDKRSRLMPDIMKLHKYMFNLCKLARFRKCGNEFVLTTFNVNFRDVNAVGPVLPSCRNGLEPNINCCGWRN